VLCGGPLPLFAETQRGPKVLRELGHDLSPPLREIAPAPRPSGVLRIVPNLVLPFRRPGRPAGGFAAPRLPVSPSTLQKGMNFEGIGEGLTGYAVGLVPPDPNGDVGPNHYVQTVNASFGVFSKTGALLYGPVRINTLWSGFGGACETYNHGDPVVQYDQLADRWLISQFALDFGGPAFYECAAISQTSDPTGAYYRYSFGFSEWDDYPHFAVWPDGYYSTYHMFNSSGTAYLGAEVCAFDRAAMLTGNAASAQCFNMGTDVGGQFAADLDGATPPPGGEPEFIVQYNNVPSPMRLELWKFHVDWLTPANTSITGPSLIDVDDFTPGCNQSCVPQPGTTRLLDVLSDRLMYRLAYRNFGDHESLVVNHSVADPGVTGIRWYEIRDPNGAPVLFQSGTVAPGDGVHRWMSSAAMDDRGNMALGYSVSGASVYPGIRATGRLAADAPGAMQSEMTLKDGGMAQTIPSRWGDYSSLMVDPLDDCTFWYSAEYIDADNVAPINPFAYFVWHTRIASFRFPDCALYFDDFEDQDASDWSAGTGPVWNVIHGDLVGSAVKATDLSPFAGCSACSVDTVLTAGSAGVNVSLYAWYQNRGNLVELIMMEGKDRWILKQKAGGTTLAKRSAPQSIVPGAAHRVQLFTEGGSFKLFVDGSTTPLITMPVRATPSGTVGYRIKSTTGARVSASFPQIAVYR
jgi:hypothetical protein